MQELVFDSLPEGAVWPFDRAYIRPPHFHGQLECLLVTRGSARLHLGGRAVAVRGGQLCWVLPGLAHVMGDFSDDFDTWVVQLDSRLVARGWHQAKGGGGAEGWLDGPFESWSVPLGELLAGRPIVDLAADESRALSERAAGVWTAGAKSEASRALAELCTMALRLTLTNVDQRCEPSVAELAACLLLSSPATDRPEAAAELGVSEGFLSRRVHRDLGVTFVEHRARARVAHFLALMQREDHNMLSAALAAGFGSYSQFFRTFTRVAGSQPSDYLRAGRRRLALVIAGDRQDPQALPPVALRADQRQRAPL